MAYYRKKSAEQKDRFEQLSGFEDISIYANLTEKGGYGTLRVGPADIKFSIFDSENGPYPLFPSYKAKDGTYKKQVFISPELYKAVCTYIENL